MFIFEKKDTGHDLKYIDEFGLELSNYVGLIVLNVFAGVAKNIGVSDPDKLAKKPPRQLAKGFLSGLIDVGKKIKGWIGRRTKSPYKQFEVQGMKLYKEGKPITQKEWNDFENQVTGYMRPYLDTAAEETAVKGILLAMASAEAEAQGKSVKQYGKKSYSQIEKEMYGGYMPDSILSADEQYKLSNTVKESMVLAHNQVAEYVQHVEDDVREAIKGQVLTAHRQGKTYQELAGDLYWMAEDKPELAAQGYTVQNILRDWHRVAITELAYVHEAGKLAHGESQARESIKNPEKAVYYVFNGSGRCEVCKQWLGEIVRLLPSEFAGGDVDELESLGIDDPHAKYAIWQGKNNVGRSASGKGKPKWWICTPMHPFCADTFSRIYPDIQEYDPKTRRIHLKDKGDSVSDFKVPDEFLEKIDSQESENQARRDRMEADKLKGDHKKDKEYYYEESREQGSALAGYDDDGGRIVEHSGQRYVEVNPLDFNKKLDEWRQNKTLPIPVSKKQRDHAVIFGGLK